MAMGECLAYSSLQADSKVKFAAWPTIWRPPGADRPEERNQSELSHMAGVVDDSTINKHSLQSFGCHLKTFLLQQSFCLLHLANLV